MVIMFWGQKIQHSVGRALKERLRRDKKGSEGRGREEKCGGGGKGGECLLVPVNWGVHL